MAENAKGAKAKAVKKSYQEFEDEAAAYAKKEGISIDDAREIVGKQYQSDIVGKAEARLALSRGEAQQDPMMRKSPGADKGIAEDTLSQKLSKDIKKSEAAETQKLKGLQEKFQQGADIEPKLTPSKASVSNIMPTTRSLGEIIKGQSGVRKAVAGLAAAGTVAGGLSALTGAKKAASAEEPSEWTGSTGKMAPSKPKAPAESSEESKPPKAPTLEEINKKAKGMTSLVSQKALEDAATRVPKEELDNFKAARAKIENTYEAARQRYKEDKKAADWGRVAEMLSRAVLKLAAGYSGLKTGVDMSGAVDSAEKWDWEADLRRSQDELKMSQADRSEANRIIEKDEEQAQRRAERQTDVQQKAVFANVEAKNRQLEANRKDDIELERFKAARAEAASKNKQLAFTDESKDLSSQLNDLIETQKKMASEKGKTISIEQAATLPIDISKLPEAKTTFLGMGTGTKSGTVDATALNAALEARRQSLLAKKEDLRKRLMGEDGPVKTFNKEKLEAYAAANKVTPEVARQSLESKGFTYQE